MFARIKTLNRYSLRLSMLAIAAFLLLGTLASVPRWHDDSLLAQGLHWLPLAPVLLNIPLLLWQGLLMWRMGLSPGLTLLLIFGVASALFAVGWYFGGAAWLGIPWVLKWNLQGFEKFLRSEAAQSLQAGHTPPPGQER